MTKEELIGLIGIEKFLYNNCEYDPHGYEVYAKGYELIDLILDKIGFPKDTTVELGFNHKDVFCRDYLCDIVWDLNNTREMSYRILIGELNKLKTDSKDTE